MSKNPSIVFMGTPEFSVPVLEELNRVFGVKCVVTLPDKPKGRGLKLLPSAVKEKALELGLPVLQPEKMKDESFISALKDFEPDIILVIAFRILPKEIFLMPKLGTFNIHASILPKYRGAAPINWAIINGETRTGLTTFLLKEKVDTGNVLLQETVEIPENSTAGDLHDILMKLAPKMAIETCNLLLSGNYKAMAQNDELATAAPKIFPEQCKINWELDARSLKNFIHGVSPLPGAWTLWNKKRFKLIRVEYSQCEIGYPGTFQIINDKMLVYCLKGVLSLLEIQPEGKKVMTIDSFLRGYRGEKSGSFDDQLK